MHKETIVAILIGLVLGLALTFGIYQWQKADKKSSQLNIPSINDSITPTATPGTSDKELIIESPADGTITSDPEIDILGKGPAGAFISIFVNNKETISTIDNNQSFTLKAILVKGPNFITIISTQKTGETHKANILVVYEPKE